ncbi:MAG: N-acetyltransferase family protein [Wenzhouxiangellaceae bacterium]
MSKTGYTEISLGRPWCRAIELDNGTRLLMRPIQAADAPMLQRGFLTLTPEEIRMRFLHPLTELTAGYAERLCRVDPATEFALVLVEAKPPPEARIAAVARVVMDDNHREAEFAVIIGREIRRFGLSRYLVAQLVDWCREQRLDAIYGFILKENRPMLSLMNSMDFTLGPSDEDTGILLARLALK